MIIHEWSLVRVDLEEGEKTDEENDDYHTATATTTIFDRNDDRTLCWQITEIFLVLRIVLAKLSKVWMY